MKKLYLHFDKNRSNDFFNTGYYLLGAAIRLGLPVEKLTFDKDGHTIDGLIPERVLNIEPCQTLFRGSKKTGFYEIDYWEYPVNIDKWRNASVVFSCDPCCADDKRFTETEKEYILLPLAADKDLIEIAKETPKEYDLVFVGRTGGPYDGRSLMLEKIQKEVPNVFLTNQEHPTEEYMKVLAKGKIIFNHSLFFDCNRRFWEGMGLGVLLTNRLPQFKAYPKYYGVEDKQFLAYSDFDECLEKIKYILSHSQEQEKIAMAGYKHIMENGLYENRLKKILEVML